MKAKYIIKTILALMVVFSATSCAEWGELPDGFSYDEVTYQQPEPEPEPDPEPDPTPVIPTERGQIIETGVVDLGLSVKWAASILGVDYCYEWGDKFDFGNDDVNCPEQIGGTKDDHATTILGGKWATPSKAQWEELKEKCLVESGQYRGVTGFIITGTTNKAIFIITGTSYYPYDYWTSTLNMSSNQGWEVSLGGYKFDFKTSKRTERFLIRPVLN